MTTGNDIENISIESLSSLDLTKSINSEFAIFDKIPELSNKSDIPTRVVQTVFCVTFSGWARVGINLKEHTIGANQLVVILENNVIQLFEKSNDFNAVYIATSKRFFSELLPTSNSFLPQLFYIIEHPVTQLSTAEVAEIKEYFALITKEMEKQTGPFRVGIAQNLLRALYLKVSGMLSEHHLTQSMRQNRHEEIFGKFLDLVMNNFREQHNLSFYADKLCITPKYLSWVVRQISKKTAGEWVDDYLVLEAKNMLRSSELSIQEIAYKLHFSNQSFFGKFFKQHTGTTPGRYRKESV